MSAGLSRLGARAVTAARTIAAVVTGPADTWKTLDSCDVLLICHDVDRGATVQGKAYSPLLDSIGDDLAAKGWVCGRLVHPYSRLTGQAAHGSPVSANRLLMRAAAGRALGNLFRSFGVRAGSDALRDAYVRLLRQARCTCVIAIGAPEALCRAAHQLGIPIADLLHSMGYTPLPWSYGQRESAALPDVILSLDPVSTETFSVLRDRGLDVMEIPHPWLARFGPDGTAPFGLQSSGSLAADDRITALVSLQWGYDNDYPLYSGILENGILPAAVERAIGRTERSVRWLLRLHPVQLRNRQYAHHVAYCDDLTRRMTNCEWEAPSTMPLPLVLALTDCHVTMGSMTAYDAAHFGVRTLLLCPMLRSGAAYAVMFRDLMRDGYADLGPLDDEEAIVHWVTTTPRVARRRTVVTGSWDAAVHRLVGRTHA